MNKIFLYTFISYNLRSDYSFAEAITDLHQINAVKNLGEGRGETEREENWRCRELQQHSRSKSDEPDAFPASQIWL